MTTSQSRRKGSVAGVTPPAGRIVQVDEGRRLPAVERLLTAGSIPSARLARPGGPPAGIGAAAAPPGLVHAERFVAFTSANRIPIDAMWARLDEAEHVLATVLAVPNPGHTAIVFASTPEGPNETAALTELLTHVRQQLAAMDLDLAQVLLEPQQSVLREAFLGVGFTVLARLSYMERPLRGRRGAGRLPVWPDDVTLTPYHRGLREELLAALDASYEDTLDCPGLRGLRRTEDILAGHEGTGEHDPALWTVIRVAGTARGALLLNPSPASHAIELVYLGLAKCMRGRGLGRQLLRHGLNIVADRSERAITLAVDEANAPAIALYRSEGFRAVLRRIALIRSLRADRLAAPAARS